MRLSNLFARRRPAPPARLLRSIERSLESLAETEALRLKLELIREGTTEEWLREAEFIPGEPVGEPGDEAGGESPAPPEEPAAEAFNFTADEIDRINRTAPGSLEETIALREIRAAHLTEEQAEREAPEAPEARLTAGVRAGIAGLIDKLRGREAHEAHEAQGERPVQARAEAPAAAAPAPAPEPEPDVPRTRPVDDSLLPFVAAEDSEAVRAQALAAFRKAMREELEAESVEAEAGGESVEAPRGV